jgi:hypothetical protein
MPPKPLAAIAVPNVRVDFREGHWGRVLNHQLGLLFDPLHISRSESDSSQENPGCLILPNDQLFTFLLSVPVLHIEFRV